MTVRCEDVEKYVCDDLAIDKVSELCRAIRAHLSECKECGGYLTSLRDTVALYRSYSVEAPEDLHALIMSSIARKDKRRH